MVEIDLEKINELIKKYGYDSRLLIDSKEDLQNSYEELLRNTQRYEKELTTLKKNNESLILGNQTLVENNSKLIDKSQGSTEKLQMLITSVTKEVKRVNDFYSTTHETAKDLARAYMQINTKCEDTGKIIKELKNLFEDAFIDTDLQKAGKTEMINLCDEFIKATEASSSRLKRIEEKTDGLILSERDASHDLDAILNTVKAIEREV